MTKQRFVSLSHARVGPGMRVYAIGDVHGCIDELNALLELIRSDLRQSAVDQHRLIFVGDYIDRGPDSKGVIDQLIRLQQSGAPVTFLRGNHDEKLLTISTAIEARKLRGFIQYGGMETLASYGLLNEPVRHVLAGNTDAASLLRFQESVRTGLGDAHLAFLEGLELSTQEGDYFFCHAGVDPDYPLSKQTAIDLMWMREPFLSLYSTLEKVVVHGHTNCTRPQLLAHRINIDTGCVYGRSLTCVVLEGSDKRFLQVPARHNYRNRPTVG